MERRTLESSRAAAALVTALAAALALAGAGPAGAYAEFEAWVEQASGRYVDCALCHTNPDGPEGVKPGQIRSLGPEELDRLNRARSAFEPGANVDSPILNDFGDHVIQTVGKRRFLEIRAQDPGELAAALGPESDLDGDGLSDAREYRDGTHPLDAQSGAPWSLFLENLRRSWFQILMIVLATFAGLYGLNHLLRWFGVGAATPEEAGEHAGPGDLGASSGTPARSRP